MKISKKQLKEMVKEEIFIMEAKGVQYPDLTTLSPAQLTRLKNLIDAEQKKRANQKEREKSKKRGISEDMSPKAMLVIIKKAESRDGRWPFRGDDYDVFESVLNKYLGGEAEHDIFEAMDYLNPDSDTFRKDDPGEAVKKQKWAAKYVAWVKKVLTTGKRTKSPAFPKFWWNS